MSWIIFFVIFVIIANAFGNKPKSDNRRPHSPRPKTSPKQSERIKPKAFVPQTTTKPGTPLIRPVFTSSPFSDGNRNNLQVNLTPEGCLSSFEQKKRRLLLSGSVSHFRLEIMHDRANRHDSKAIKILFDDVNVVVSI